MRAGIIGLVVVLYASAASAAGNVLPDLVNYHEYSPSLSSSGQPERDQIGAIQEAGVQLVVNLSPRNLPASLKDEQRLVEETGMRYAFIPVDWDNPSEDDLARFFEVMDGAKGERVLVHCWLNSRSSAFVYLYRTLRDGQPDGPENDALVDIWDNNKGYELRRVAQWREFIDQAKTTFRN